MRSDARKMTSPGNVVFLPYIRKAKSRGVRLQDEQTNLRKEFSTDGTAIFAFSRKRLELRIMYFSN